MRRWRLSTQRCCGGRPDGRRAVAEGQMADELQPYWLGVPDTSGEEQRTEEKQQSKT